MRYQCVYISGGGTEHDGGVWKKKETPKNIIFTLIKEPFWGIDYKFLKFKKDTKNLRDSEITYHGYGHVLKDWEDGSYTIYPEQCGTPHIFNPI